MGMRRRDFFGVLGGSVATWPFVASAQITAVPVVGFLSSATAEGFAPFVAAAKKGLSEAGYSEGRNLAIEYRWASGQYDRLPAMAADLVQHRVAAIIATGSTAPAQAAKASTNSIPIVFVSGGDPVKAGLVASLNRPGGNVTGVSMIYSALVQKRLELLFKLAPKTATVGVLVNPNYPEADLQRRELKEAAEAIKQQTIHVVSAASESDIDAAFETLVQQNVDALLVANDPYFDSRRDQIAALAARHTMPAIYSGREYAAAGGLMSYGASITESFHQAGVYTARILKGEKPSDLPVMQPTKFELVINLKVAKTLGLDVPPALLAIVDDVIE
jgi:putative ABC transport system substrate-binding protein